MLEKKQIGDILEAALNNGGDFADIYVEKKQVMGISCEDKKIERVNSGVEAGVGIRVIAGDNTAYAYANDLRPEKLKELAKLVSRAAYGSRRELTLDYRRVKPVAEFSFRRLPNQVAVEDKVELVKKAECRARGVDPRIGQVSVGYSDAMQEVTMANSHGEIVSDRRVRTRFMVNVVAQDGGTIQTGYEVDGGLAGFEFFDMVSPEELADEAARRAVMMLAARPAPAGRMPVVLMGEAGGTMVHEACGHGLEADLVQKNLSVYAGKVGEKVASDLVTVIDDATLPGKYGSFSFDDEGVPGRKKVLIDRGVLKEYMYDRLAALKEGRDSTGNGRRESYQHRPVPRMTNTYIARGKDVPEKIIKELQRGLLVKKMGGGQVNTTNGDFVFDVAEGYLIVDGQVGPAVRGATLSGNGPQVLKAVDRVGNDLGFGIGTCGKDGQGVPVGDAQPTLRIPELTIGGVLEGGKR